MRKTDGAVQAEPLLGSPGTSAATHWGYLFVGVVLFGWSLTFAVGYLNALSFLTVVGFVAAFFGYSRPAVGVLGITLLCTLDPLTRHFLLTTGGFLRWNTLNYWLLIVMAVSSMFVFRVSDVHSKILKIFIAVLTIELVTSPAYEMGIQHLLGVVTLFGLLVYLAQAADDPDIWYMVGLVNGITGAVGGLIFFLTKDSLPFINPNAWSFFPETAIFCICLGFRHATSRPHGQLTLGLLAVTNFAWAFLSGSRGGTLITLVSVLFVALAIRRSGQRLSFFVAALVLAVVIPGLFSDLRDTTVRRFDKLFDEEQTTSARTSGRSDLALAGWHIFTRHPLGVGTGGFAPTWGRLGFVPGLSAFKRGEDFQAHSGWVKVLAENGWPGMLLMIAYVTSFAVVGVRHPSPGSASLGLLVTATLTVTFVTTEFQGKGFWMLAAGATAQLHPEEMARSVAAEVRRFRSAPRRLVSRAASW